MKNLINAVTAEQKKYLTDFIKEINKVKTAEGLDKWIYNDLLPKGKKMGLLTLTQSLKEVKAYLIKRKETAIYKRIEQEVSGIKEVFNAGKLIDVKIQLEWKRSRMWGSNPTAEAWVLYTDKEGQQRSNYVKYGPVSGCGYDKGSTAVAGVLNQINEVLKPLYQKKNAAADTKNHELLGYGSGYGILPSIEGGVGVSCYPRIFEKVGYKFETQASGKTFDVYTIKKA